MMAACNHCTACLKNCSTGAISPDRFLLYAEKCLPYHNEKPGNIPFAEWIDPGWHNCLVGCLTCQVVCPQNRCVINSIEDGACFTQQETELIIQGAGQESLSPETWEKLQQWDLVDLLDVMPRNLEALAR